MSEAITFIWRLTVATELILAVRLLIQGLGGAYPALLSASCVFALRSSFLIFSFHNVSMGRDVWRATQPLGWILSSWIVLELFSKWTRSYPGIGRFGKLLFCVLVVLSFGVSLAWWPFEWKSLVFDHDFRIYFILARFIHGTLALFTLSMWLFFRNYPAPVAANVVRHNHITVIYFAVMALSELAFTLNGIKAAALMNLSIVAVAAGCFSAWAILLTRKGEEPESVPMVSPAEKARIEKINLELLSLMKSLPGLDPDGKDYPKGPTNVREQARK